MNLMPVFGPRAAQTSEAATDRESLTGDFDRFLTLLTTQLQNQDPLKPLETAEFTNQLVGFTQVEQTINVNKNMEDLLSVQEVGQAQAATNLVGKHVEALGSAVSPGGSDGLFYTLDQKAASGTVSIVDQNGNLVRSLETSLEAGTHRLQWDGIDNDGNAVSPARTYSMKVEAFTAEGDRIGSKTGFSAQVLGLSHTADGLVLETSQRDLLLDEVLSVRS